MASAQSATEKRYNLDTSTNVGLGKIMTGNAFKNISSLIVVIALGAVQPCANAANTKLHDVEYEIIAAALNHGTGESTHEPLIDNTTTGDNVDFTSPDQNEADILKELSTTPAALGDWLRKNKRRYALQPQITLNRSHGFFTQEDRLSVFNDGNPAVNWQRFKVRFPHSVGVVRISRPGIDDIAQVALIYIEFECGVACGSGRLINLMQNETAQWVVTGGTLLWITSPDE